MSTHDAKHITETMARDAIAMAVKPGIVKATPRYYTAAGTLVYSAMFDDTTHDLRGVWLFQPRGDMSKIIPAHKARQIVAAHIATLTGVKS